MSLAEGIDEMREVSPLFSPLHPLRNPYWGILGFGGKRRAMLTQTLFARRSFDRFNYNDISAFEIAGHRVIRKWDWVTIAILRNVAFAYKKNSLEEIVRTPRWLTIGIIEVEGVVTLKDAGTFKKPKDSTDYGFLAPAFIYICSRQLRFVSRIRAHHGCKTVHSYSKFYISAAERLIYSASIPPATNPTHPRRSYFASSKCTAINNLAISSRFNFVFSYYISNRKETKKNWQRE